MSQSSKRSEEGTLRSLHSIRMTRTERLKTHRRHVHSLLTGLEVLDLADEKASFCSKLLADLGAEVIKIEPPGGECLTMDRSLLEKYTAS